MSTITAVFADAVSTRRESIELIKWLGLAAMLTDHVGRFALGIDSPLAETVGAFAFPLFAVALAAALSDAPVTGWVHRKLLFWAVLSQLIVLLVREPLPLNILFTFLLGLAAFQAEREHGFLAFLGILALGVFVEYGPFGVLFIYALRSSFFRRDPLDLVLAGIASLTFTPWNSGVVLAPVALVLGLLLLRSPIGLPRAPGLFYRVYAYQWLFLWLASGLLALSRGLLPYASGVQ